MLSMNDSALTGKSNLTKKPPQQKGMTTVTQPTLEAEKERRNREGSETGVKLYQASQASMVLQAFCHFLTLLNELSYVPLSNE